MSWMLNPLKNRWSELGWSLTHRIFHWKIGDPNSVVLGSEMVTSWLRWCKNPAHCSDSQSSFPPFFLPYFPFVHQSSICLLCLQISWFQTSIVLCFWFWISLFRPVWNGLDGPAEHRSSNIIATSARGFKTWSLGKGHFERMSCGWAAVPIFFLWELVQPESKSEVSEGLSLILFDWICIIKQIHDMTLI